MPCQGIPFDFGSNENLTAQAWHARSRATGSGGVRMGSTAALLLASLAVLVACTWASLAAPSPAAAAAKAADLSP